MDSLKKLSQEYGEDNNFSPFNDEQPANYNQPENPQDNPHTQFLECFSQLTLNAVDNSRQSALPFDKNDDEGEDRRFGGMINQQILDINCPLELFTQNLTTSINTDIVMEQQIVPVKQEEAKKTKRRPIIDNQNLVTKGKKGCNAFIAKAVIKAFMGILNKELPDLLILEETRNNLKKFNGKYLQSKQYSAIEQRQVIIGRDIFKQVCDRFSQEALERFFSNDDLNIAFGHLTDNLLSHFYSKFKHNQQKFRLYEEVINIFLGNSERIWWRRRRLLQDFKPRF